MTSAIGNKAGNQVTDRLLLSQAVVVAAGVGFLDGSWVAAFGHDGGVVASAGETAGSILNWDVPTAGGGGR